jgi:hypothetical protein
MKTAGLETRDTADLEIGATVMPDSRPQHPLPGRVKKL